MTVAFILMDADTKKKLCKKETLREKWDLFDGKVVQRFDQLSKSPFWLCPILVISLGRLGL